MSVLEINEQDALEKVIAENDTVVVDFSAPAWCIPCQRFAPQFEKAAEKSDAVFVMVDVDKAEWVLDEYGVRGVPTVMVFRDGKYEKHIAKSNAERTFGAVLKQIG